MHAVCCDLQRRGIAAWNVEYRRLGSGGGWPASLEDVQQAIRALPALAESRLDVGRVAIAGHSAGGHLALLAAAGGPYAGVEIAGVLALAAVSDLALADELGLGAGAVRELLGDDPAALLDASPRARLPLGVRHVHVHGDADDRVPVAMTTAFVEAAGREAAATVLPGVDHFALIDPSSAAWALAAGRLEELLYTAAEELDRRPVASGASARAAVVRPGRSHRVGHDAGFDPQSSFAPIRRARSPLHDPCAGRGRERASPLENVSAPELSRAIEEWSQGVSNPRPPECHSGALPTELWPLEQPPV